MRNKPARKKKTYKLFTAVQRRTEYDQSGHAVSVRGVRATGGPFKYVKRDDAGIIHAIDSNGDARVFNLRFWRITECEEQRSK